VSIQPRKFAFASLLALFVLGASASCRDKLGPYIPEHVPFAYVQPDCGPTDGLAMTFHFASKQVNSGKYEGPFVEISIYEDLPHSTPANYAIGGRGNHAFGSRCVSAGKCELATSGALHISQTQKGISGEYELHFQSGVIEKGIFNATLVQPNPPLLCG
jgi:hypothetical protein